MKRSEPSMRRFPRYTTPSMSNKNPALFMGGAKPLTCQNERRITLKMYPISYAHSTSERSTKGIRKRKRGGDGRYESNSLPLTISIHELLAQLLLLGQKLDDVANLSWFEDRPHGRHGGGEGMTRDFSGTKIALLPVGQGDRPELLRLLAQDPG